MVRLRILLLLSLSLSMALAARAEIEPPSDKESWVTLSAGGFELVSNATAQETTAIATDLLRMRDAIGTLTKLQVSSSVPTRVYVFRNAASFAPYRDTLLGRRNATVSGLFVGHPDVNLILLQADAGADLDRLVYHELAHSFLKNTISGMPLWFHEGLAEYYSTFSTRGNEVSLGQPLPDHVRWLRAQPLIPLAQLFAIDASSKDYNEGVRQGVFYAESWALVHYLIVGNPQRKDQLPRFLDLLAANNPVDQSFRAAFNTDFEGMENELRAYVRRQAFSFRKYSLDETKVAEIGKPEALPRGEVLARLGSLLARGGTNAAADAEVFLTLALALDEKNATAYADLGLLYDAAGRRAEADAAFEQAVGLGAADPAVYLTYGAALLDQVEQRAARGETPPREHIVRARNLFTKAAALDAESARALAGIGATYVFETNGATAIGIAALEKSLQLAPGQDDALFNLMQLYANAGRREDAQRLADQFAARTRDPEQLRLARETVLVADVRRAEALLKEEKVSEAATILREVQGTTTNDRLKQHLATILGKIDDQKTAERQVARLNIAIELANKGKTSDALAAIDSLIPEISDPALLESTIKLRMELAKNK